MKSSEPKCHVACAYVGKRAMRVWVCLSEQKLFVEFSDGVVLWKKFVKIATSISLSRATSVVLRGFVGMRVEAIT